MWAVAGEILCTVSIAPQLYSLSTVIKILPMSAGLWVCLGGGTSFMFQQCCPFHSWNNQFLCLLTEWCWKKHNHSLPCLSEQEIPNPAVGAVFCGTDPFLCKEEYKVEPINAYY